ncbi:MAG TPA: hypothetical protein VGK01_00170 [Candidatus Angelobacter sp.]
MTVEIVLAEQLNNRMQFLPHFVHAGYREVKILFFLIEMGDRSFVAPTGMEPQLVAPMSVKVDSCSCGISTTGASGVTHRKLGFRIDGKSKRLFISVDLEVMIL